MHKPLCSFVSESQKLILAENALKQAISELHRNYLSGSRRRIFARLSKIILLVWKLKFEGHCRCVYRGREICYNQSEKGEGRMAIRLAENIRAFRKARGLAQEQLSEVLGVMWRMIAHSPEESDAAPVRRHTGFEGRAHRRIRQLRFPDGAEGLFPRPVRHRAIIIPRQGRCRRGAFSGYQPFSALRSKVFFSAG